MRGSWRGRGNREPSPRRQDRLLTYFSLQDGQAREEEKRDSPWTGSGLSFIWVYSPPLPVGLEPFVTGEGLESRMLPKRRSPRKGGSTDRF